MCVHVSVYKRPSMRRDQSGAMDRDVVEGRGGRGGEGRGGEGRGGEGRGGEGS